MFKNFSSKYLNTVEHDLFPIPFTAFTIIGAWCPYYWNTVWKKIYSLYSLFFIGNTVALGLEMAIYGYMTIITKDVDFNTLFTLTALCNGLMKISTFFFDRHWVMEVLKLAVDDRLFKPINKLEHQIINDYAKTARLLEIGYSLTIASGLGVKLFFPMIQQEPVHDQVVDPVKKLPVPAWLPFDLDNPYLFAVAYVQQILAGLCVAWSHISTDLLLSNLMLHLCLLLKLLRSRLGNAKPIMHAGENLLESENKAIANFAANHQLILIFAETINEKFSLWLILFIFTGAPNLFMNLYQIISPKNAFIDILSPLTLFVLCLLQISVVCWCGNEVTLHSIDISDAAYEGGWTDVRHSARKGLIMVMGRAFRRPIMLSIANLIPLNVESFLKIIKLAYTAINVLNKVNV